MALHWNGCTLLQHDYQRFVSPGTGLVEKMLLCLSGAAPSPSPCQLPAGPLCIGGFTSTGIRQPQNRPLAQTPIMCPAPDIWGGDLDLALFDWLTATPLVSCYSPCCPYLVCLEIGPGFEISDSVPGTAPCVFSWCAWLSAMARGLSLVLTANNGNASSSPPPPPLINPLVSW